MFEEVETECCPECGGYGGIEDEYGYHYTCRNPGYGDVAPNSRMVECHVCKGSGQVLTEAEMIKQNVAKILEAVTAPDAHDEGYWVEGLNDEGGTVDCHRLYYSDDEGNRYIADHNPQTNKWRIEVVDELPESEV